MHDPPMPQSRLRRALWATAAFLLGFAALLAVVVNYFLIPAMQDARNADPAGKRQLSAYSTLLLAVVLFIIGVGLFMIFASTDFSFQEQLDRAPTRTTSTRGANRRDD